MTTLSVVATVEASNLPPRVRLDVTDTGTPTLFAATVTRLDPDGRTVPVRTSDGNPLVLSTSGTNRVGLLYDYEMPFGASVTYSTVETPGSTSAAVTVPSSQAWLVHLGVPSLSMPIEARIGSFDEEEWAVQQGIHWPMGREFPVVQTDGQRKAPASSVTVAIESLSDLAALKALVADAGVLLLNVPATLGIGVDPCYIAVGNIRNRRPSDIGTDQMRAVELPFQVVDRPEGGSASQRTWTDVVVENATWATVLSKYATWSSLLAGP